MCLCLVERTLRAHAVLLGIGSCTKTEQDGERLARVYFVSLFCAPMVCLRGGSVRCGHKAPPPPSDSCSSLLLIPSLP